MGCEMVDNGGRVQMRPSELYVEDGFNSGNPCDAIDPAVNITFADTSGLTICSHADGTIKYKDRNGNTATLTTQAGVCHVQRIYGLVATGTDTGLSISIYK